MKKVTKHDRLAALKRVITSRELSSQDEVIRALAVEGIVVSQTTLSRDIKELKVVKTPRHDGGYCYSIAAHKTNSAALTAFGQKGLTTLEALPGYKGIDAAGNMVVIHTQPGFASSIASSIDGTKLPNVLGTIAGDDTIFVVTR